MREAEWLWPERLEAVAAAPDSHRVLFENDRIRVLEVVIKPGTREPEHTHPWPSVMIVDQRARIRYFEQGVLTFESPTDASDRPAVQWLDPEGPHAVENIDTFPYHAFRIELLKRNSARCRGG